MASVREGLLSSLSSGKISHAYLFVGPRGSGKTSAARIMAKIINCKQNEGKKKDFSEPCGECESCRVITRGSSVDVIEIDAASNGLVDDIRELRDRVRLAPVQLAKKVYIIDEVHMVSTSGFNALLKTLEEPPEHVMFILCTTESQKVPETILSRCVRVNFTKATIEEVVDSLKKVVLSEGLSVDEEILKEIAEATDGSFREGHKLLEQLSGYGKTIDRESLIKVLGTAGRQSVKKLLDAAINHQTEEVIKIFDDMEKVGTKASILVLTILAVTKTEMERCVRDGSSPEVYLKLINNLILAADKIKISPLPLLPLEIVLLSLSVEGKGEEPATASRPVSEKKQVEDSVVKVSSKDIVDKSNEVTQGDSATIVNIDTVKLGWVDFIKTVALTYGSLAGMLRLVSPVYVEGKSLTLSVTSRFQQEMLEREVKKKVIEEEMAKLWGPLTFKCVLIDRGSRTEPRSEDENLSQINGGIDTIQGVMLAAEKIFG
ncbi:MAG: polymerase III, subunit gamma and tau protein [Candidatus Collierbacteria bacterium GW2011_GWB1_45_35]|uniref:DNA polymerase III subunit gamma/tau n=2 Tax=Candidatus Collieribacteriota TaxID=1752725 RepID=A0A0G1MYD1_9BACT|nr:MAG: polymerase III, subunit gamma and tau protein [Microgenomates group bacterium GW2011_GWC1_44_23]KKT85787.1 MAG: polymerase III, subunit gamma and tau protein [Candidatus Collierbacteria bacterium GW2011_GWA2_44_99]KKT94838.1 MAG: polymerase III, subunit gamma and tau protein [Candidatus Collierbacteria bacterium GW2011_GWA1_45_15]KKT99666.1 MAG: polymerase III, subunit gamma and tau protein [Candidatus Collierbacteria bacterium GW2011_GWB2_45_17]KKU05081.1 MAG: polymerase III, subunit g